MRTLLLMRGLPASGKSTWIRANALEPYALSPDSLRLMASSPVILPCPSVAESRVDFHVDSRASLESSVVADSRADSGVDSSSCPESALDSSGESTLSRRPSYNSPLYAISQKNDKHIWKMLFALLELRCKQGDFTIIDATHTSLQALRAYEGLASSYRYRLVVLDFSHVGFDEILARNATRGYKSIPEPILRSMYERLQGSLATPLPSRYTLLRPENLAGVDLAGMSPTMSFATPFAAPAPESSQTKESAPTKKALESPAARALLMQPIDLNAYKHIHHIGDIHGCFEVLVEYLLRAFALTRPHAATPYTPPYSCTRSAIHAIEQSGFSPQECSRLIDPHAYYIFLGDYIDRGVENAQVVRFLLAIMECKNICLLEGNHERWLNKWGREELGCNEFALFSAPDLTAAGLTPKDTHRLHSKLRQCAYYTFDKKLVLCTHGGLSTLPHNLLLIPTKLLIYGSGGYEDMAASAQSFADTTAGHVYQVFGHRNREKRAMRVHGRSFALEGGVEFGGALRACILGKSRTAGTLARIAQASLPRLESSSLDSRRLSPISWLSCMQRGDGFTEIMLQSSKTTSYPALLARHRMRKVSTLVEKFRASSLVKEHEKCRI